MEKDFFSEKTSYLQELQQRVYDGLKTKLPEFVFEKWLSHMELVEATRDKVVFVYSGSASLREFNTKYRQLLDYEICSTLNRMMTLVIRRDRRKAKMPKISRTSALRKLGFLALSIVFVCVAFMMCIFAYSYVESRSFTETFYSVGSVKLNENLRVIQISDLHSVEYGVENEKLVTRIRELKPDLIVMTGDTVESSGGYDHILHFCGEITAIAPTYFVYGNNENQIVYGSTMTLEDLDRKYSFTEDTRDPSVLQQSSDRLLEALEGVGVHVLLNEYETVTVGSNVIDIYGVLTSNPSAFWPYAGKSYSDFQHENPTNLKLTLIHEPLVFTAFSGVNWGDLVLAGHTHGGVIRVPYLGGLYTREGGLFPDGMVYGRYSASGTPVIVSSGLINTGMIRVNNPPELVIIDVNQY